MIWIRLILALIDQSPSYLILVRRFMDKQCTPGYHLGHRWGWPKDIPLLSAIFTVSKAWRQGTSAGVIPLWRRPLWRMPVWRFHYGAGPAWRIPVWRVPVRRRSGVALFQFGAFQYGAGPVRRISLWRSSGLALRSIVVNVPCRV